MTELDINRVYLAGPMRGLPEYNFPAFHAAAKDLRERGYEVWSPAERDEQDGFNPETGEGLRTFRDYMAVDLPAVLDSDAIVVLPAWEESQGARLETHVAREVGLPVLTYPHLSPAGSVRSFGTGATRDTDEGKYDYEGFFSPLVLRERAAYMHRHRLQTDGSMRDSDNWQRGIPFTAYAKSGWRHFHDFWLAHRGYPGGPDIKESLCALMFNAEGYLHELIKGEQQ